MKYVIASKFFQLKMLIRDSWIAAMIVSILALVIHDLISFQNLLLSVGIALGYILAYAVNDYFDAEDDSQDKYKSAHNFWVNNQLSVQYRLFLLISILSTIFIIFSNFDMKGLVTFSISIFVLWAYSTEPFKFRNSPPLDILIHSLFIMSYPYYITLYLLNIDWGKTDIILIFALIIGSIIIQLENQIRYYDIDIKNTKNTTILIGIKRSHITIKLLSVVLIILIGYGFLIIEGMLIYLPYALIYSPIIIYRLISNTGSVRSERFIKIIIFSMIIYSIGLFIYLIF